MKNPSSAHLKLLVVIMLYSCNIDCEQNGRNSQQDDLQGMTHYIKHTQACAQDFARRVCEDFNGQSKLLLIILLSLK